MLHFLIQAFVMLNFLCFVFFSFPHLTKPGCGFRVCSVYDVTYSASLSCHQFCSIVFCSGVSLIPTTHFLVTYSYCILYLETVW